VADEDDRSVGCGGVDDLLEVAAELLERRVLAVGVTGAAMRALVVVDAADEVPVGGALEVPAVEVEAVAVREDHGHVGAAEPAQPSPGDRLVDLVDLDVERHSVLGDDRHRLGPQRPERDLLAGPSADRALLAGEADRAAGRRDADRARDGPDDPHAQAHPSSRSCSLSTYRRVIRPPILVTIS
jgi:hypothetical protein